jgi:hypothetical protein
VRMTFVLGRREYANPLMFCKRKEEKEKSLNRKNPEVYIFLKGK